MAKDESARTGTRAQVERAKALTQSEEPAVLATALCMALIAEGRVREAMHAQLLVEVLLVGVVPERGEN